jgi:GTP-binding protein HflX
LFFERPEAGRRAVLLHLHFKDRSSASEPDTIDECAELARSADINVVDVLTGSRERPHPRWFVGSGKLEELAALLAAAEADLVIVNHGLSPAQQRNLEAHLECRVLTRTELILHIFADRARTYEGKLQVELAQLQHAQTRLVRGWTHLDRQKGGIGLRGAGETQLELDQRMLSDRIRATQKKLEGVGLRRGQGRRRRQRGQVRTISLVGYTNAGKSTLFNALTTAGVLAEDRLFATLDPTMRRIQVPGLGDLVLADTVGFISHLPHALVNAFKATLEEVANADLLVHVVDASYADPQARIAQVNAVLEEIGARELPVIIALNKIDALDQGDASALAGFADAVPVSGRTGEGLPALLAAIGASLGLTAPMQVVLQPDDGKTRALLYQMGAVLDEQTLEDGSLVIRVQGDPALLDRLGQQIGVSLQPLTQSLLQPLLQEGVGLPKLSGLPDDAYQLEQV